MKTTSSTPSRTPWRRAAAVGALFAASLLSCGREITGPENGIGTRFAHGLSFLTEFPGPLASVEAGAGSVVPFNRVRIVFRREDGSIAFDRIVEFPEGQAELALSLSVPLSRNAPSTGEPLQLSLRYINAAGDTVFSGGPVGVLAVPGAPTSGSQPSPVNVPVTYTGPGAEATGVRITPDTVWVDAGAGFAFSAEAHDASQATIADAPLVWSVLDAGKLTLPSIAAGSGTANASRGPARLRVALAAGGEGSGWADTAWVMIAPMPGSIALVSGGGQTGAVGATLADSVIVRVNATDGQPLAGRTVHFVVSSGGGDVSPALALTDSLGRAAAVWTLGTTAGAQTLTASVDSAATVSPLVITATGEASAPAKLAITTQPPTTVTAGTLMSPVVVEVRTAADVLTSLFTDSVRISVQSGPDTLALLGTRARVPAAGVVTFDSLSFEKAGTYTLAVSAAGLSGATTTAITVQAAAPDSLILVSGGAQIAAPGTPLAAPVVVRVLDAFGNPVAARGVAATVLTDGGSVTPDTATTTAAGEASFAWTLANVAGAQTLRLDVPGTAVAPLDVSANDGVGPIVATKIEPLSDTLTFIGETRQFTASSLDEALNVIAGTYSWTSLDDSIATVDSAGVVTAVQNGSARIVATEAGGSADTATVLVQQAVASVTITPGTRELYLGTTFAFTAQAVDGGGTPMAVQPAVEWSTQSVAIATVDSVGVVTGTGLGSTQLRALMAGVQGVAGLTIKTPITRIAVVRDSIGFVQTDTFTVVALNRTRSYRAVAYDTLDAPMSGITFTFESANPAVAAPDSTGTATVRVRAVANGLTSIRATAQGVTGAASLRVQQQLSRLDLSPGVLNIGPGGNQLLTVRGLDPDGSYLPSVTGVTFASLQPAIATVNATTGVVTGVSVGTALVTASRDSILGDTVTVTVGEGVPAVISFGRDSLAIGRSGSQSVPIYLSRPSASPVTVLLAVADTFAYFSAASINIPAGATSANATLNGRSAGLTTISAIDGSVEPVYAGDSALLAVQANVRFSTTSYSIVAQQQLATQILLSDPAPAGGSYIAYQYGTPGRVEISPDPAFIPAGQLAANVVITALAGGGTTVTPVTTGATGQTATITTYPATLDLSGSLYRLGLGQQRTDIYVQSQSTLQAPQLVTLESSDTSIVKVPATVTIPGGSYYVYFGMQAAGPNLGSAWIRASAPGWTTDSVQVSVSTPRVGICCNAGIQTTSPSTNFSVSSRDSLGNQYSRLAPLVVTLESSDTSIVRLNQATGTIAAGNGSVGSLNYVPAGGVGTAYIRASAPGHAMDSISVTVTGPKLSFSAASYRVGLGQRNGSPYVQVPNNTTAPLQVTFTSTANGAAGLPDSTTIPAGTYYDYFAYDGLAVGTDTVIASAPGHQPDTAFFVVTTPRIAMSGLGTYDNFRPPLNFTVWSTDSAGGTYPRLDTLTLTITSSDTTVARVTPTAYILPGQSSTNAPQITFVGEGTAIITVSAPGHSDDADTLTVRTPKLSFSWSTFQIGRRQRTADQALYVSVPSNVSDTLPVTITRSNAAADSLIGDPNIPAGTYYKYFGVAGLQQGLDTLIASAPGYLPDTAFIVVNTPRLVVSNISTPLTTTTPPRNISITAVDSTGNSYRPLDTLVVSVVSTDPSVMQASQASYRILPTVTNVSAQVSFVGPGSAAIIISDSAGVGYGGDTTNVVTVTGPSLSLYNGTPNLGMRQHNGNSGAYVSVPNNIVGSPLTVYLTSSDPSVVSVQDSVVIPVGTYYAYFRVTAHDAVATVQITATAVGYASASVNQQVTAPRFVITSNSSMRRTQGPVAVTVYATDADGNQHPVTENVVVRLSSSAAGVASFDSATVTIAANASVNNTARVRAHTEGTTQLSASDDRVDPWRYGTGTTNLAVVTPQASVNFSNQRIGVGQYTDVAVSVPDNQRPAVLFSVTRKTGNALTPDTVTVDSTNYSRNFRLSGIALGVDTVKVAATGYLPDSGRVSVELGTLGTPSGWTTSLSADSVLITLRTRGPDGAIRRVTGATTFTLAVDANLVFTQDGATVTSVTVPADSDAVTFYMKRVSAGTANVSISNANYQTFNSTVTVNAP